jgi:hypothetical protein
MSPINLVQGSATFLTWRNVANAYFRIRKDLLELASVTDAPVS